MADFRPRWRQRGGRRLVALGHAGSVQAGGRLNILAWDGRGYRQWDNGWKEVRT